MTIFPIWHQESTMPMLFQREWANSRQHNELKESQQLMWWQRSSGIKRCMRWETWIEVFRGSNWVWDCFIIGCWKWRIPKSKFDYLQGGHSNTPLFALHSKHMVSDILGFYSMNSDSRKVFLLIFYQLQFFIQVLSRIALSRKYETS